MSVVVLLLVLVRGASAAHDVIVEVMLLLGVLLRGGAPHTVAGRGVCAATTSLLDPRQAAE